MHKLRDKTINTIDLIALKRLHGLFSAGEKRNDPLGREAKEEDGSDGVMVRNVLP
jgi:hypothetical protein